MILGRQHREFVREIRAGRWQRTADGILLPRAHALLQGIFTLRGRRQHNLLTNEALALIAADTWPTHFYATLWGNDVTPAATWDGATFAATAGELTSGTEGYNEATRPEIPTLDGVAVAEMNIRTATSLTVYGAAILDGSTKGSTSDHLISAVRFGALPELMDNNDIFDVTYMVTSVPV